MTNTMSRTGQAGPLNHNWRGGRSIASNGYMLIRVGRGHHLADVRGYAYEHRLVAEAKIGRALRPDEHVHHVDGDKLNNAPENIEVLTKQEHAVKHRRPGSRRRLPHEPNRSTACACGCGSTFQMFDSMGRPRRYVHGHNIQEAA